MQLIKIQLKNGNTNDILVHLKGQVFHLTTQVAYNAILKSGKINHNRDGQFELNSNSQNSFGRLMGYVCFVDLRNDIPDFIEKVQDCYNFLGPSWFEKLHKDGTTWDLAYLILNSSYYNEIIPYAKFREYYKETRKFLHAIPNGEVWIKDYVPLTFIEKVLLVSIYRPAPDKNTISGRLHHLDFEDKEKK